MRLIDTSGLPMNPVGRDGKPLKCWYCESFRHVKKNCPDRKRHHNQYENNRKRHHNHEHFENQTFRPINRSENVKNWRYDEDKDRLKLESNTRQQKDSSKSEFENEQTMDDRTIERETDMPCRPMTPQSMPACSNRLPGENGSINSRISLDTSRSSGSGISHVQYEKQIYELDRKCRKLEHEMVVLEKKNGNQTLKPCQILCQCQKNLNENFDQFTNAVNQRIVFLEKMVEMLLEQIGQKLESKSNVCSVQSCCNLNDSHSENKCTEKQNDGEKQNSTSLDNEEVDVECKMQTECCSPFSMNEIIRSLKTIESTVSQPIIDCHSKVTPDFDQTTQNDIVKKSEVQTTQKDIVSKSEDETAQNVIDLDLVSEWLDKSSLKCSEIKSQISSDSGFKKQDVDSIGKLSVESMSENEIKNSRELIGKTVELNSKEKMYRDVVEELENEYFELQEKYVDVEYNLNIERDKIQVLLSYNKRLKNELECYKELHMNSDFTIT